MLTDLPPAPTRPPAPRKKLVRVGKIGDGKTNNTKPAIEKQDVKMKKIVCT
jgi:hypothetical protein